MRKLIGDRKFYMMLLRIAFPIMIQNGITNFVALLDNIMIGAVGTDQMSGVLISLFLFLTCVYLVRYQAQEYSALSFTDREIMKE